MSEPSKAAREWEEINCASRRVPPPTMQIRDALAVIAEQRAWSYDAGAAAERERIVAENAARDLAVRELIEAAEEFLENDGSLGEYDLDSAHRLDAALAAVRAFYPDKP